MKDAADATWNLESYHSGVFCRLLGLLEQTEGFQFLIAEYSDRFYRRRIIQLLTAHFPRQARCDASQYDDFASFESAVHNLARQHNPIHVSGTQDWKVDASTLAFVHAFNHQRERFARSAAVPIILWLPPRQTEWFAHEAPDLWAWRSGVLDFCLQAKTEFGHSVKQHVLDLSREATEEQLKRLEEIDAYLQSQSHGQIDDAALYLDKARILLRRGDLEMALRAADQSAEIYNKHDDRRRSGFAKSLKADILQACGQLDEALRIREQEQLPVFEKLGDERETAVT
ncbi:MAG: hypothetical protein ACRER2_12310, partial [Methylococcales bacterium]